MKKAITLILAIMLCLSLMAGCCLSHEWVEADCTNPKICTKCEKTEGEALGHDWADADCITAKTCTRCGETEGEALGHDWADADCVTAKTCSRCGETEGEALGHSYSGWEAAENDTMINACAACGDKQEAPMDREFIGRQQIMGKWKLDSGTVNGMWFTLNLKWTLEFHEDGTFDFQNAEPESGKVIYEQFYNGEQKDFYVFEGNVGDHSYNLNYEPVEDVLYIAGNEYVKFTRVIE